MYGALKKYGVLVSIRKAKVDDALEIKALISSLSHFYLENEQSPMPDWFLRTLDASAFERRLSNDWFTNYVYVEEEDIVGYISMRGESHLYHLFVAEAHQRKGISRALWNVARSGVKSSVYTLRSSLYAIPIYKRFGFIASGPAEVRDGIGFQSMKCVL